jgi:Zn-dependent protease with chaperone function
MSASRQPLDARSLDLGLHHLGVLATAEQPMLCAVCTGTIPAGAKIVVSTATFAAAHRACGEVIGGSR